MKEISLSGKYKHLKCILDDNWAEMLSDGGITLVNRRGYACSCCWDGKESYFDMIHNVIVGIKGKSSKLVVDHIDGNRLNNKEENLRIVTQKENMANKNIPAHKDNVLGIKGVYKKREKFVCRKFNNGKLVYRKGFENIDDADLVSQFNDLIFDITIP